MSKEIVKFPYTDKDVKKDIKELERFFKLTKSGKYPIKEYLGKVEDKDSKEGTFVVAISTEDKDRSDEVLKADGFELENYRKNPVVLWAHDYSEPPIAKALWVKVVANKLKAKLQFAKTKFAQEIKMLYEEGFMKAWSVGFMPKKWIDGDEGEDIRREYTKVELLEFSAVPVPCNPMALSEALKMVKNVKLKEILEKEHKSEEIFTLSIEGEKGKHDDHKIKLIAISKKQGIEACYCEDCKKVIAYKFDKDNDLGMEDAKEWIKDHGKNIAGIIDNGIKKTIDNMSDEDWKALGESIEKYLETGEVEKTVYKCSCIDCGWETESEKHCKDIKCEKCGGTLRRSERPGPGQETDDAKDDSKNLVTISDSLLEFEEGKIDRKEMLEKIEKAMINVIDKVGAVLSKKNKSKLITAKENIQNVLDVAEIASGDDEKAVSLEDIIEAVKELGKSLKTKEVKKEMPPKQEDKEKEVSDVDVQDIKTAIRDSVGKYMDKRIREIRLTVLGKV